MQVGLIGYGLLGRVIASRLQRAGHEITVFDVDLRCREAIASAGLVAASDIQQAVASTEVLLIAVYSTDQVSAVLDAARMAGQSKLPKWAVCVTTLDPTWVAALAQKAAGHGLSFVEFPISGTSREVELGNGVGLFGGSVEAFDACGRLLEVITPTLIHVGPIGSAAKTKLAINLVLEVNRSAFAEGLVFAESMGLDLALVEKAMIASAAGSKVMIVKGAKMRNGEFSPEGRIAQSLKDIGLMLAQAQRAGLTLPFCTAQADLLCACVAHGRGELDGAAVVDELRAMRNALQMTAASEA
jgi:L-threonate 2-dehydrogenase